MNEQRLWKCRCVDQEEHQTQVSLLAHRPWKSLRDSHIPTASATTADGKVEIQNQDSHFPTARLYLTNSIRKETWRGSLRSRPSGSSFDENMLRSVVPVWLKPRLGFRSREVDSSQFDAQSSGSAFGPRMN